MTADRQRQGEAPRSVLVVAAGEQFGGAERQILSLLSHMSATPFTATLAVFFDRELAARARAQGARVVILPGRGALRPSAVRSLAALARAEANGVVHFHGYKAAVHVALARLHTTFASVSTIHGTPELYGTSTLGRWRSSAYDQCLWLAIRWLRSAVVFVSQDLARRLSARTPGLHYVIANGIDADTVADLPRPQELSPSHFNVVIAGRLDMVKGVHFAIEAMRNPHMPLDVHLLVVGDGPQRAQLESACAALSLRDRVTFTGFRDDAAAFIVNSDLLLMPSLYEGLPYTMLEAIASGTPIAASHVGGLAETLEQGRTALLFQPADPAAIAAAVARASSAREATRGMALRARGELLARFDAAAMARAYAEVYTIAGRR
ncbi:MAG TPA: glycosyltransferase [Steroidobacteraceae bacterium]|nr:glycosyltransferase [Steroidobacteraceae bacterium]